MGQEGEPRGDEVAALRDERDRLQAELEATKRGRNKARYRVIAVVLVVLSVLTFAAAVPGVWAKRTLLDTDRYVATVAPLAENPAMQEYVARTVTTEVFEALDVEGRLSTALGDRAPRLAFLAGPITSAVQGFVQTKVQALVASDAFTTFWTEANRFAHAQVLAVLEGNGDSLKVSGDQVVLNLLPLVNQGLAAVASVAGQLVGRQITLPEITTDEVPSAAAAKIEAALGVDLPDRFGTITVYDGDQLAEVQQAVDLFRRGVFVAALLFLILGVAAVWVSRRRRRTLLQLMIGLAVVLVLERRFAIAAADHVVDLAQPENRAAARAVVDSVLSSLLTYTARLLLVAVVVIMVALVTGPYRWAVWSRRRGVELGRAAVGTARGAELPEAPAWVAAHRDALMVGLAALAVVVLLAADLTIGWFLVVVLIVGGVELLLYRLGSTAAPAEKGD
jgi:hypothetical protein